MDDQQHTKVLYYSNSLPHLLLQVNTDHIHSGLWWILWMLHFQSNRSISVFLFSALLHLQFCNYNIQDINIHIMTLRAWTHTYAHTCAQTHAQTHEHTHTHRKIINSAYSVQKNREFLIWSAHSYYVPHMYFLYFNVS